MKVTGKVTGRKKSEAVLISLEYGFKFFAQKNPKGKLSNALRTEYRVLADKHFAQNIKDCVVVIDAEVASSEVVHGLYELWKEVHHNGGTLCCANYPEDYIESLFSLGLANLSGFKLAASEEDAITTLSEQSA